AKIIMDHLRSICTDIGMTLVISLHQVDMALKYTDRIIGLNRGVVVFDGTPGELTSQRSAEIYAREPKDVNINLGERNAS
ncbi:MAG: phosphonate ABC transporter ATP-binding protein, partial [Thermacetogeniaceae bacterium]